MGLAIPVNTIFLGVVEKARGFRGKLQAKICRESGAPKNHFTVRAMQTSTFVSANDIVRKKAT
jgi:hypothetical protein